MSDEAGHRFDLDAYFARIGHIGELAPTAETLCALQFAHITSIPFENVSVQLGQPMPLDVPSLARKLVRERRGGYCFEQNGLFAAVLERLGFKLIRLAARVRLGAHRTLPRTHMLLLVEADTIQWVADVGFGGWGLLKPIALEAGAQARQGVWTMRLRREENQWILQCLECPGGPDLYAFTLEPQQPVDYEPANHYCATHPNSRFVQTFTVQLPGLEERTILRGRDLIVANQTGEQTARIDGSGELLDYLKTRFGISLSDADRAQLSRKLQRTGAS